MNEHLRQTYLESMGIQPWFPRFILPAAKPSLIYDELENVTQSHVSSELTPPLLASEKLSILDVSSAKKDENNAKMQEIMASSAHIPDEVLLKKSTPVQPTLSNVQPTVEQESRLLLSPEKQLSPPFRLSVITVTEDILVMTDTPLADGPSTSRANKLLHAILYALGWRGLSESHWQSNTFTWPFVGMTHRATEQEATEAVQGFLINRFGLFRRKYVLLLGTFSARHALGNYGEFDSLHGVHTRKDGQKWGVSYSLDQILKIPTLKAEVWAHFSPLIQARHG